MAERAGFGQGFSAARRKSQKTRRGRARGVNAEAKEWIPVTKLGRLVKDGKIVSIEEIFVHSMPIKEFQIIDRLFATTSGETGVESSKLKDEVLKIMPVQKQTKAGQRTRFKAIVAVGDFNGHVGVGVKCSKEVASAIRGGIILAKLSIIPVRRGYWGNKIGEPHTVVTKVSGKSGSVTVQFTPAPRGTQIVGAPTTKKLLQLAGIHDCFTRTTGMSRTLENNVKAVYRGLNVTNSYLTPDMWNQNQLPISLHQKFSDCLAATAKDNKKETGV